MTSCTKTQVVAQLDYIEQTARVLFLKHLEDLERDKGLPQLAGKTYQPIIAEAFTWKVSGHYKAMRGRRAAYRSTAARYRTTGQHPAQP